MVSFTPSVLWIPGQTLGVMTTASENCAVHHVEDCTAGCHRLHSNCNTISCLKCVVKLFTWLTCVVVFAQDVGPTQLRQVQSDVANDVSSAKDVQLDSTKDKSKQNARLSCKECHLYQRFFIYTTKMEEFVSPPNISETVAVRILKLAHHTVHVLSRQRSNSFQNKFYCPFYQFC